MYENIFIFEQNFCCLVTEKILTYRASYEEVKLLDDNNLRWTDFCKNNLNDLKNKKKNDIGDKLVLRLMLIILGCLTVGLTPLMTDVVLVYLEYIVGITMAFIGTISILVLWRANSNVRRVL